MKKIAIIIILVTVTVFGVVIYSTQTSQKPDASLDESFMRVITDKYPALKNDSGSLIEIVDRKQRDNNWYVVSIKSVNDEVMSVPVRLVLFDDKGWVRIIAGPGTRFTEAELLQYNLPDSVILELKRS